MNVVPMQDHAKLQAEVISLAHELVERTEANPADPMVARLATRIAESSTRLNR
jgi:hypothetical protein